MILYSVIALLIAVASGWCVVSALWSGVNNVFEQIARMVLAVAIGLSLHSLAGFVLLLIAPAVPFGFIASDLIVLVIAMMICLGLRRKQKSEGLPGDAKSSDSLLERVVMIATLVMGSFMVLAVVDWLWVNPSGQWDAWAMWNYKARVIARGGEYWTHVVAPPSPHPDYPLHQPVTIARLWRYCGFEPEVVPQAYAVLVILMIFGWLVGMVGALRGAVVGCIAGVLLVSNTALLQHAGSQYADTSVGLYMVLSLGLLYRAMTVSDGMDTEGSERGAVRTGAGMWLLAGLAVGGTAWTKQEGQLFAVATFVIVALTQWVRVGWRSAGRQVGFMFMGALPGLACAVMVHGLVWWVEPMSSWQSVVATEPEHNLSHTTGLFFDPERHRLILNALVHLADITVDRILWVLVLGYALCAGVLPRDRGGQHVLTILAMGLLLMVMVGGYYGVYLLTSKQISWQLTTSVNRLGTQIWPSIVLVVALGLGGLRGLRGVAERGS